MFRSIVCGVFFLCFGISTSLWAQNFRVQVAAFTDSVPPSYFLDRGVMGVIASVDEIGTHRYLFGSYPTYLDAEKVQQELIKKGFEHAAIIDLEAQRLLTDLSLCSYFKGGPVPITENDSIRFIYFGMGQSTLQESEKADLDYMLEKLKSAPTSGLHILGYTDAVGNSKANLELATARARNARNYLLDRGVNPDRLSLRVYGEAVAGGIEEDIERQSELEEIRKLYRCVVLVFQRQE